MIANRIRKSIGVENSYAVELVELNDIYRELEQIAQMMKLRLDKAQTYGRTLTLKIKYEDYQQITRSRTVAEPIQTLDAMNQLAKELLVTTEVGDRTVRLLGLTLSNFDCALPHVEYVQLQLAF
jgi:DNA polymerase IV